MSSILNALNKVEEEQEQLKAQENLRPEDIDTADAVGDLLDADVRRDKMTLQVSPMVLIGGGFLALIILVATVAFVVATVMKPESVQPSNNIASLPPVVSNPTPPVETIEPVTPNTSDTTTPTIPVEEMSVPTEEPAPTVPATETTPQKPMTEEPADSTPPPPAPENTEVTPIAETPKPIPAPKVIEKTPEPLPKPTSTVLDEDGPLNFKPATPDTTESIEQSENIIAQNDKPIHIYPRFSNTLQMKYGFETFKINMVFPKSARNPYGSAIINREKVFEGNSIADSQIILYKVEKKGVAFENSRTGKRYYSKF